MKKVLLTTFPSAFLHQGGGEREMFLLKGALEESGLSVDIYGPTSRDINTYDAAIHFSTVRGSEILLQALHEEGVKLILWPNLWFVSDPLAEQLQSIDFLLSYFEAIIFRSKTEEKHFRQYFDLDGKKILRSECIVSRRFHSKNVSNVFRESYGLDRYAIWPGIIEPQKNQISAIRAFKYLNIDLVISGRVRDISYMNLCKQEAGNNIHFIPAMPFGSDLHLSALKNSSVFIELPLDFPGTSAVEAAISGCKLLLSKNEWSEEIIGEFCTMVEPTNVEAIVEEINMIIVDDKSLKKTYPYLDEYAVVEDVVNFINEI
jgi:glycosyltransferase involved in cell wall biosynthesis